MGYSLFRRDRKTAQGGRIIVYTHNSLSAERRSDLELEQIEQISIEFKQFQCDLILVFCFYRPADSTVSSSIASQIFWTQLLLKTKKFTSSVILTLT